MPTIDGGGRDQRIKEALEKKVICRRCQVEMVPKSTFFDYLGHNFHTEILCCRTAVISSGMATATA